MTKFMIRKILTADNPVLRKQSKPVTKFDESLKTLVDDMFETLDAQTDPEGVGLAAVQIGVLKQVFILYEDDEKQIKRVFINPKVLEKQKGSYDKKNEPLEGCLSIPHYYGPLIRSRDILIEFQDTSGRKTTQKFTGFAAQIILHEMDHLKGRLFIDRLFEKNQPLYEHKKGKWYEVDL